MEILHLGNVLLRQKSQPVAEVTEQIRLMSQQMLALMEEANGVGLAAPQVGKLIRMFVLEADDQIKRVFINPQIVSTSTETSEYEEGCLSIPKIWEKITRPSKVTIQALDEYGKPFTLEADGYLARIIQHEYDHLDGILYIDRGDSVFKQKTEELFLKKEQRHKEKEAVKLAKQAKIEAKINARNAKKSAKASPMAEPAEIDNESKQLKGTSSKEGCHC